MDLHPEEPAVADWTAVTDAELTAWFAGRLARQHPVILVDGRSAGGKTTFASRLADLLDGAVIHTDDIAWHEHPVDWSHLLIAGVLEPWARGEDVDFTPPAWTARGRAGSVRARDTAKVLVVEGVGAGRADLAAYADVVVWLQSDRALARTRGIVRDITLGRSAEEAETFWDEWMLSEEPFLAAEKPWERADLIVCGTPPEASTGTLVSVPERA